MCRRYATQRRLATRASDLSRPPGCDERESLSNVPIATMPYAYLI
jgi:hypothetical protein